MSKYLKKRIREFKPYRVQQIDEGEIKLDAQENPYSIPPELRARIQEAVKNLSFNRYPDPAYQELKNMISAYCGVKSSNILVGNGSDELILSILLAAGGENRTVAAPEPTFSMYRILSALSGSEYLQCPLAENFNLDTESLLSLGGDVVFITYPNNPTGNCFSEKEITEVIKRSQGLVVLDEAYYEFSGKTFATRVNEFDNLLVLRTFSKAFALAGIRAGYLLGNRELTRHLRKVQLPYNISALNEEILKIILASRREILETVEVLIKSRNIMQEKLRALPGIRVFPSDANFILLKIEKIDKVVESLKKNKIRVRRFSQPGLKDYLRVTVGAQRENRKFLKALEEVL